MEKPVVHASSLTVLIFVPVMADALMDVHVNIIHRIALIVRSTMSMNTAKVFTLKFRNLFCCLSIVISIKTLFYFKFFDPFVLNKIHRWINISVKVIFRTFC